MAIVKHWKADTVSAVCAVLTLAGGGGATILTWFKADQAAESAAQATAQLQEAKRQTELSARNLAEIRGLRSATEDQANSAARFASASESGARSASDQAKSLAGSRLAAEQLVGTAQRQLDASEEHAKATLGGRIIFRGISITTLGVNQKSNAKIFFNKTGQSEPANITMWSAMVFRSPAQTLMTAPACSPSWQAMGPFTLGEFTSTANSPLSAADHETHMVKGGGFFLYGALCYKDTFGRPHRTDFCAIVRSSTDYIGCPGTPDPT